MTDAFLTIITPTYNRASKIGRLYESLINQDNDKFIWLIIDDGSIDETPVIVDTWIKEKKIDIIYEKKDNGGKHTALNWGISHVLTPLLMIVDSDDYLTETAVSVIKGYHQKYIDSAKADSLCGYSFLRAFGNGAINGGKFSENEMIDSYKNQRINRKDLGDKAEVFYTDILRKYPFPVFEHEKFMPEDAVWLKMSGPYQMVHINEVIYISDYLEGGLTKTGKYMKIYSPYGMMYRSAVYLNESGIIPTVKYKMLLLYVIYGFFAKRQDRRNMVNVQETDRKSSACMIRHGVIYQLMKLPGYFIYLIWLQKYQKTAGHRN